MKRIIPFLVLLITMSQAFGQAKIIAANGDTIKIYSTTATKYVPIVYDSFYVVTAPYVRPITPVPTVPVLSKPTAIRSKILDFARATGGTITQTTYLGESAIKYDVKLTDAKVAEGRRSQSVGAGGQIVSKRWMRNRVAIDPSWVDEVPLLTVVIFDMHDDNYVDGRQGSEFHSPFDIVVAGKNWVANVRYGNTSEKTAGTFILGPVVKGKFVDIDFHLEFTKDESPGVQQVWMDGKLVLDTKLPMGYTHGFQPYWKQGVYAWAMNDDSQLPYLKAKGYISYVSRHEEYDNATTKPW